MYAGKTLIHTKINQSSLKRYTEIKLKQKKTKLLLQIQVKAALKWQAFQTHDNMKKPFCVKTQEQLQNQCVKWLQLYSPS